LHGRYARTAPGDERDRASRLGARATARGFAVLALRGRLGECTDPDLADWYCWPSNERNADRGPAVVDAWARALAEATGRTGARRTFLLGFSSGGYFAGLVASRGLLDAAAVVVAHAGPVEPVRARDRMPALLLLSADDDVAQDDMIRYDRELAHERWPHDSYARSGGHALTDEDIDAALTFFSRAGERLPLVPPLPLHRAVPHVRDAEAQDERAPDAPLELGSAPTPDQSPIDHDASAEVTDD
jgi:predicted esterase